jgi:type II secretory pathway predicted ATPase ExeA
VFVRYAAQTDAIEFLQTVATQPNGMGLLQGPRLSGKSTIIREFVESLDEDIAVAVVDGAGLKTSSLLNNILGQFGYDLQFNSDNELANMLRVFALQQTAAGRPPLLIVENTHAMNPSALRMLCELAEWRIRARSALRFVLASDRSIESIVKAPATASIGGRLTGSFFLGPMTADETREYLFAKLRAGGSARPESIIPEDVCSRLYQDSAGWPGVVDRLVLLAIAKAESCPLSVQHIERPVLPLPLEAADIRSASTEGHASYAGPPRIVLTLNGKTLKEITMDGPRLMIGRSELNDLSVNSRYISRHHALLIRHGKATFLMDLNSTNGTYVNSRRVSNHVMKHDDIVSLGQHGLKFLDPGAIESTEINGPGFADTVVMKSLEDIRRLLARENTVSLPAAAPNPVDSGGT